MRVFSLNLSPGRTAERWGCPRTRSWPPERSKSTLAPAVASPVASTTGQPAGWPLQSSAPGNSRSGVRHTASPSFSQAARKLSSGSERQQKTLSLLVRTSKHPGTSGLGNQTEAAPGQSLVNRLPSGVRLVASTWGTGGVETTGAKLLHCHKQ